MRLYGSAIPSFFQGMDEATQRAILQQNLLQQRQQAQGLAALANAYGGPPQPQVPQPPQPGAQSQPMPPQGPPPGQTMQPPPQMPPGQMTRGQMGPPPQQQGPMQPYTAPKAPPQPQQPPPQAIQPPPQQQAPAMPPAPPQITQAVQSALPNLHDMASKLQEQGITGMPLYYALMQHKEMLSQEGKQQLAELNLMLRKEQADSAGLRAQIAQQGANTKDRQQDLREKSAAGETATSAAKIELMSAQAQAALRRARGASPGSVGPSGDVEGMAEAVAAGHLDPLLLSTKGGWREKVLERAIKINPEYDSKNYAADKAFQTSGMRTAGTAGANTAMAAGAAQGGADILMDVASKVPRGSWRSLNKLVLAGKTESNDPATGAYLTALNTFVNEYARAINPKGTATVSDKEHAREILAASDSPEALAAKMDVLRQEMARGRQAPQDVASDLRSKRGTAPGQPKPTAADIAYAKAHPEVRAQFKAHFGVEP